LTYLSQPTLIFAKTGETTQEFTFSRELVFHNLTKGDNGFFVSPSKTINEQVRKISCEDVEKIELQTTSADSGEKSLWISLHNSRQFASTINSIRIRSKSNSPVTLIMTFTAIEEPDNAIDDKVDIIERNEWGAWLPANGYSEHEIDSIIIHHSWYPDQKAYKEAETIFNVQKYHMNGNGWDDIGYHYLVGPDGLIFRGRPEQVSGAHCVPNSGKVGICLIGNYDPFCDPLPEKGWDSVKKLTVEISERYDVPPDMIFGHRDFSPKSCPGETVYREFPELKAMIPFPSKYRNNGSDPIVSLPWLESDDGEY